MTEQDIEKIVEDNDSQNTKRSTKVAKELFADYVEEKKRREPEIFLHVYCRDHFFFFSVFSFFFRSMYNETIIRFGFCDIENNQGLGKGYQEPQP